ncbi:hypothetical protein K402DRAFT_333699 [Aulographum hederae CBS 113979]|uniref:Dienelactone hydrolase n=1 Tax=Aulographum hederae CBS 113979 TaxID=1176131 RepID=A0A6G1GXQ5_9PEZI|nr:hypothetical protein K402DRAFT_333699 [Aulographum hederae CBS 113979]
MGASNATGRGFLSFNSQPPRLYITCEGDEFDETVLKQWENEGFEVSFIPMPSHPGKPYANLITNLSKGLPLGANYALLAYGLAASACLTIAEKPLPHCAALICFYPPTIPAVGHKYPSSLNLTVHIAASQTDVIKLAVEGKVAQGGKSYIYESTLEGFAEQDLDEWDRVASELSWSRTLAVIRRGFKQDRDFEELAEEKHSAGGVFGGGTDVKKLLGLAAEGSYLNCVPTMTGAPIQRDLYRFYQHFLLPSAPPTLKTRLLSRTMGSATIVDELLLSFTHSNEIPWLLPGVPPTHKEVEIAIVSILGVKGGKISHEHLYWDQASVLVQIGALDPMLVPEALKKRGCQRLPVTGVEQGKKVVEVTSQPSNELVPNWRQNERRVRGGPKKSGGGGGANKKANGVKAQGQGQGMPIRGNN